MSESQASAPLDINGAAAAFAEILEPKEPEQKEATADQAEAEPEAVEAEAEPTEVETEEPKEPEKFTVKIDGKEVEVTLDELKNGYQRQSDYTRKTMEVSEQRKAAEAEYQKARQERDIYAQNLNQQQALLTAVLQEQSQTNWQQLLETDPVEYLKQQHLFQQRQAAYQKVQLEQQQLAQIQQVEQDKFIQRHLLGEQQSLLSKVPEWKDKAKSKAERESIKKYLADSGYQPNEIDSVADHRAVLIARKAMLYDNMMSKAKAAAKKMETTPQRVERPGSGNSPNVDKRSAAFQRLSKSGSIEDAAAVFASIL